MERKIFIKLFLLVTILGVFTNCSPTSHKEENVQINKRHRLIQNNNNSSYCPSLGEQDELVHEFAYACEDSSFVDYLFNEGYSRYSLYTFKDTYEQDGFEGMLNVDSLTDFLYPYLTELVHTYCTNYSLRFNIVIPYSYRWMSSLDDNNIYIVNALYRQALGDGAYVGVYKVSYVNSTPVSDLTISESFCQTHKVIVLTFRDCITGWQHFSKGEQSISDWLIKTSVSYPGYGCTDYDDLANEYSPTTNSLVIPILHSKKAFQGPCCEKYDHFCKFGKPEREFAFIDATSLFTEILGSMGADPYITSWTELVEGESFQYIPIAENSLGLDLYGHDFFVSDTSFILSDGQHVHIPEQICEYDENMNAQRFVVEWQ